MKNRPKTVVLDDGIEQRVNARRVAGPRIRSFSDVTREALCMGLDLLEKQSVQRASIASTPVYLAKG